MHERELIVIVGCVFPLALLFSVNMKTLDLIFTVLKIFGDSKVM